MQKKYEYANGRKPRYTRRRIAWELDSAASGATYCGHVFRVASDLSEVTPEERALLDRWLTGANTPQDRFRLQDLACKILAEARK